MFSKQQPAKKHLRKAIQIRPHHIFLYRGGKQITEPDHIDGQQPIESVKGFAKYEVICHPFSFEWKMQVMTHGVFGDLLSDRDKVIEALKQSTFHGQGGRRGVGYGEWKIKKYEIQDEA